MREDVFALPFDSELSDIVEPRRWVYIDEAGVKHHLVRKSFVQESYPGNFVFEQKFRIGGELTNNINILEFLCRYLLLNQFEQMSNDNVGTYLTKFLYDVNGSRVSEAQTNKDLINSFLNGDGTYQVDVLHGKRVDLIMSQDEIRHEMRKYAPGNGIEERNDDEYYIEICSGSGKRTKFNMLTNRLDTDYPIRIFNRVSVDNGWTFFSIMYYQTKKFEFTRNCFLTWFNMNF